MFYYPVAEIMASGYYFLDYLNSISKFSHYSFVNGYEPTNLIKSSILVLIGLAIFYYIKSIITVVPLTLALFHETQ